MKAIIDGEEKEVPLSHVELIDANFIGIGKYPSSQRNVPVLNSNERVFYSIGSNVPIIIKVSE